MLGCLFSTSDVVLVLLIESYSLHAYCELNIITAPSCTVVSKMGKAPGSQQILLQWGEKDPTLMKQWKGNKILPNAKLKNKQENVVEIEES